MRIIQLTESGIHNLIKSSVQKLLKEEYGLNDFNGLSDEEYDELQQKIIDSYEQEDQEVKDDLDSEYADMYNYEDDKYIPGDGDLYRYGI